MPDDSVFYLFNKITSEQVKKVNSEIYENKKHGLCILIKKAYQLILVSRRKLHSQKLTSEKFWGVWLLELLENLTLRDLGGGFLKSSIYACHVMPRFKLRRGLNSV